MFCLTIFVFPRDAHDSLKRGKYCGIVYVSDVFINLCNEGKIEGWLELGDFELFLWKKKVKIRNINIVVKFNLLTLGDIHKLCQTLKPS